MSSWDKRKATAKPTGSSWQKKTGGGKATAALTKAERDFIRKTGAKRGGTWHNPLTSALHEVTAMASGIPQLPGTIGQATENAIYSVAPGLKRYAKQYHKHEPPPVTYGKIVDAFVKDYKYRWGPLFEGHPELFAQRFTERPISDLTDIITVLSAGTGGATKLGAIGEAERTLKFENAAGKVVTRPLRGTEFGRHLKRGADRSLRAIVKNTDRSGSPRKHLPSEWNRAAKIERKQADRLDSGRKVALGPYLQASEKLDTSVPVPKLRGANKQRIASNLRREFVTPQFVKEYAQRLREHAEFARDQGDLGYAAAAEKEAALITQQKVLDFMEKPTAKMLRTEERAGGVVAFREGLMAEKGYPLGQAKDVRPWQSLLMLRGAKPSESGLIPPATARSIEDMIAQLRKELPEGAEPSYQPHEMGVTPQPVGPGGGGSVRQGPPTRQNLGHLFDAGLIAFNQDLLGRGTQRLIRWANYLDKHDVLRGGAREIHGVALPHGWRWVKATRGERIPFTEQHLGEFDRMLGKLDLEEPGIGKSLGDDLFTDKLDEVAIGEGGGRLAVPEGYATRVLGDYTRSSHVTLRFLQDLTSVWRALVLNLRPAWLVNNIVGNTLLYSVQHSGRNGLRAYLSSVLETGMGPDTMLSHLLRKEFTSRLPAKELAEILPDEVLATFLGTQMPEGRILSQTLQHRYSPARWARNLDQNYEKALRKAIADRVFSNNPRVKAFYDAMPAQEKSWMTAVKQAVAEDSTLPQRVSGEINAALGDFTNMGSLERNVIRGAVPFYAWYKAITVVMLKMPLDSPYRTSILAKLGQIGQESTDEWWRQHGVDPTKLPTYLRSVLPAGNSAWRTTGTNPYLTPSQLTSGLFEAGNARDILGTFNPVVFAPIEGLMRAANRPPWEKKQSGWEGAQEGFLDFLRFLPESRLAVPYKPKLSKGGGTHLSEFASYMGWTRFQPDFEAIAKRYNGR